MPEEIYYCSNYEGQLTVEKMLRKGVAEETEAVFGKLSDQAIEAWERFYSMTEPNKNGDKNV